MNEEDWEHRWLESMGGRRESDVRVDEKGKFVLMLTARGGEEKVYIPSVNYIKQELATKEERLGSGFIH
jgi:hypothetical protein